MSLQRTRSWWVSERVGAYDLEFDVGSPSLIR